MNSYKRWAKMLVLTIFAFMIMPIYSQNVDYQNALNKGKEYYYKGNYDEALKYFKIAEFHAEDAQIKEIKGWKDKCMTNLSVKLLVSNTSLYFNAEPKDTLCLVSVVSNREWSYSCDADWCLISRNGDDLLVSCQTNNHLSSRECRIKVKASNKSATINVNQSGGKFMFYVSNDTLVFDSIQSTKSVYVYSNADDWRYDSVPNWCHAYRRQDSLFITCHKNDSVVNRYAKIVVLSNKQKKYLEIIQKVGSGKIKTNANHIVFGDKGGKKSLSIRSNSPYFTCKIIDADWIVANKKRDTIIVECQPNSLPVSRNCKMIIGVNNKETIIDIEQESHVSILDVSENILEFNQDGGSKTISIISDDNNWNYYDVPFWCKVYKYGDGLNITAIPNNTGFERNEHFIIRTDNKALYITVSQTAKNTVGHHISFNSIPVGMPVYIDGNYYDRTPSSYLIDSTHHVVKIGRRLFDDVVFDNNQSVLEYKPGLRYLILTGSNTNHLGVMSGFIGTKKLGMFNHFQIGFPIDDILSLSENKLSYIYAVGPSVEICDFLSLYVGTGPELYKNDSVYNVDLMAEFGAMLYYKRFMFTVGYQMQKIITNDPKNNGFFVGLGLYFDRYCIKTDDGQTRPCVSDSRRWWSLNYIYAPNTNGIMIGDIGDNALRGYLKALYINRGEDYYKQSSITTGFVFTLFPGYTDICTGLGFGAYFNEGMEWSGMEGEIGLVVNIWRFPITIMFHEFMLDKDTRYPQVEFGIGFHFGKFGKHNQPQYY